MAAVVDAVVESLQSPLRPVESDLGEFDAVTDLGELCAEQSELVPVRNLPPRMEPANTGAHATPPVM